MFFQFREDHIGSIDPAVGDDEHGGEEYIEEMHVDKGEACPAKDLAERDALRADGGRDGEEGKLRGEGCGKATRAQQRLEGPRASALEIMPAGDGFFVTGTERHGLAKG